MGKIPTNSLGKSSELKLHCFCLYNAYSMPKDIYSVGRSKFLNYGFEPLAFHGGGSSNFFSSVPRQQNSVNIS